jgi:glutamyl-tRNA reductase
VHDVTIIGTSYRTAGVEAIGRLLLPREELASRLAPLAEHLRARELLYLGTCNRLEIVVRGSDGAESLRSRTFQALTGREPRGREAARMFRLWTGAAAFEHLLLVACGLDSAQVGDREIASQLRDAWITARSAGVAGARIDELVTSALLAAREVRRLDSQLPAPGGLAARAAAHINRHLAGRCERVALLGVSPMTRAAGRSLARCGVPLLIVNRSVDAAARLASELGGTHAPLATFRSSPPAVSAVVTAVGTAEHVLDVETLQRLDAASPAAPPLIVDMGVPANVHPDAVAAAGPRYIGMEQLVAEAAAGRTEQVLEQGEVRAVVDRHLDRGLRAAAQRLAGPMLGALHESYVAHVEAELAQLLRGTLSGLDDSGQAAVRRWGSRLARRMAHVPVDGLRRLACEGDLASVEACVAGMAEALEKRRAP